ncbi:hypothetical protein B0H11DRAFT_2236688 [Mycena galericulata]|nr:hypothetical protein B0H11DRAFT_2236688 [Mycena galericulata]
METLKDVEWSWKTNDITDLNLDISQRTKELMKTEGQVIALAVENLIYGTFEADWTELGLKRKKELALEGLYRAACVSPRDNSRVSCPELTIDGLVGDGLTVVLQLRRIMAHDPTGNGRVKEVFLFTHPYIEHQFRYSEGAPDLLKAFISKTKLLRNFCIVDTLEGILRAYHNHPLYPSIPTRCWNYNRTDDRETRKQRARDAVKKNNLKEEIDGSQCKEQKGRVVNACSKRRNRTDRQDLKCCARCKMVWYCSSACQGKDWPDHKKFCGKQHFDSRLLAPAPEDPEEFIGCPGAAEGYIRTPALWRQIWYLSKPDSQHTFYHFDTTPGHTRSIAVRSPPGAPQVFLVARRRAMSSGSVPAIHMMFTIIRYGEEDGMTVYDLSVDQIRRQFELEYRVEITPASIEAAEAFTPPTPQELQEEHDFLNQRLISVGRH